MAGTFSAASVYTLAEIQEFYNADGSLSDAINLLRQNNPILENMPFIQGNQTNGHKHKLITALPTVYFRNLYEGITPSKSGIAQVSDECKQLSTRWATDVDELRLYDGDEAQSAFRRQEGIRHIDAMKNSAVSYLFYGNPKVNPEEFLGLSPRYAYKDGPNVINAAGTTDGALTSIWGIVWGKDAVFGVYPKNMPAGIQTEDLGKFQALDADGKQFTAIGDEWKWNLGLAVADWSAAVRICNIEVADLYLASTETDYIDLRKLTIQAKNKIKPGMRGRMQWYVSETVMNALEMQNGDPTAVHLRYGQLLDSKEVLMLHGKPVFQCDGLLETEELVPAAS